MLVPVCLLALVSLAVGQGDYKELHYAPGRDTMVHLFEWKWEDIAKECEQFLGPKGYAGIQVSPIQENIIVGNRPWWERYQPISYLFVTRSGNKEQFADMVQRCNKVGVRIYVDAVFNHMTGDHQGAIGTGGSRANTFAREYYSVPFEISHFHAVCGINDYKNPANVRNCELVGLHDLDQGNEYVRNKIVSFLNEAVDAGVAGFRIDAAKHMWPEDLHTIYSRIKNLNPEHGFPENARPYIVQEVIDYGGEGINKYEYNRLAAVTEFKFGAEVSNAFRGNNLLKWFVNWGEPWALLPSRDALVFIDNHDTQRSTENRVLTHKSSKLYKMAVAFMLAHPYGRPRVMSSYHFDSFDDSPPADAQGNLLSPIIHADNTCSNGFVCEHRWRQIYNMAGFRNAVNGTEINSWWDNGKNQIAFCRGRLGCVAFNGDQHDLNVTIKTTLPAGKYCDVISGSLERRTCTGKVITVQQNGNAQIKIPVRQEDGVLAIHVGAKLS